MRDGPAADGGQADGAGVHGPLQRRVLGRAGQQDTRLPVQRPQVRCGDHVQVLCYISCNYLAGWTERGPVAVRRWTKLWLTDFSVDVK